MTINMLIFGEHVCNSPWFVRWRFVCSFVVGVWTECGGESVGNVYFGEVVVLDGNERGKGPFWLLDFLGNVVIRENLE